VPRRLEEVDVVDAELGVPSEHRGTESVGQELSAKANGEAGKTAPHRVAEPAAGIGRDVIDVEAAAEHDRAVVLESSRQGLMRAEYVVGDAGGSEDTCESTEARLRLVL
jgi:hypothetical protein